MNPRHALALAAVLAATVLTGGAAILGLASNRIHTAAAPAHAVVAQLAQPAAQTWEERD